MAIYYIFKFLRIWGVFSCITLLFSLLVMATCSNIFKVNNKETKHLLIPIYNLLHILDIVKLSRINFALLLFPVVNVLIIYVILYRLSIIFHTSKGFAIGLIIFPLLFLPALNFSKGLTTKEEKDEKVESYIMLTEEEINELNKEDENIVKVDSTFKSVITPVEDVPSFKANKIKYDNIMIKNNPEMVPKKATVEPVKIEELLKSNNKKESEENNNIEIVEL